MSDYVPTAGEFRQAYVEASGASMAQESYYAEQLAEFERGLARIKADAVREALLSDDAVERAARALCAAAGEDPDSNELWDEEPPWLSYADEARAALTAAIGDDDE